MIEIKHLSKVYENAHPLKDINAVINKGDVISIIGPSGCGKSSLLRCLNLLTVPSCGQILIDGEDILSAKYDASKVRKKIGMVFQSFNLFNNMTVIENIMAAPRDLLNLSKQQAYDKAMELLDIVGLSSKALDYPSDLSGGQKQRVAICRTLAMSPEVILFDEPTSALDPTMVDEVKSVIADLAKQGNTMVIVTHDMEFAKHISTRVFYLDEGIVYEEGSPSSVFDHPQKEKTRAFVKQLKQLELSFENNNFDFASAIYKINDYCYRNHLEKKISNDVVLAFEELCKQILVPIIGNNKMKVTIEYAKKTSSLTMIVQYGGEKFNPKDTENKLALSIFEKTPSSYSYKTTNEEYKNKVLVKF